jgi:NAD(P)-dependent dehydrogenase (short-subunit alcohol dehydrogenase family)
LWDWTFGVNLIGTINGVQTLIPRRLRRDAPGHVVNTASAAGLAPTGAFMYGPAKAAVIALTEELRKQPTLASHPIGATVLCPGPVATDVVENIEELEPDLDLPEEEATAKRRWRELEATFLQQVGMDPDTVGSMAVEAVRQDRLYVHTDRMMLEPRRKGLHCGFGVFHRMAKGGAQVLELLKRRGLRDRSCSQ